MSRKKFLEAAAYDIDVCPICKEKLVQTSRLYWFCPASHGKLYVKRPGSGKRWQRLKKKVK